MASLEILQGCRNKNSRLSGANGRKIFMSFDPDVAVFNRNKYERCGSVFEYCLKQNIVDDLAYQQNADRLKEMKRNQEIENERNAFIKLNEPLKVAGFFETNKELVVMGGVGLLLLLIL